MQHLLILNYLFKYLLKLELDILFLSTIHVIVYDI
jgi:hypothetical protein